jgi:hypothetical protein
MAVDLVVGTRKGAMFFHASAPDAKWQASSLALKGWLVTAATRDDSGRSYLAVTHDVWGATVVWNDTLDPDGWQQVESPPRYDRGLAGNPEHLRVVSAMDPMGAYKDGGRYVDQIWKLHAAGDVLYAGVSEAGIFRSEDRGKSWQVLPGLNEHPQRERWGPGFGGLCAHSLLTDANNPDRIWVGISAVGVLRSDDGGQTFDPRNEGVNASEEGYCVHAIAHDPSVPDVIYRQDHRGMYRSDDAGDAWQAIENGLPLARLSDDHECVFGFPVAFDPASGSVFAVPLQGDSFRFPHDGQLAVYRSQDRGQSWHSLTNGLPGDSYTSVLRGALALDHGDPCGVYFGTTSGAVYAGADRGASWQRLASDLPKVLCVAAFSG